MRRGFRGRSAAPPLRPSSPPWYAKRSEASAHRALPGRETKAAEFLNQVTAGCPGIKPRSGRQASRRFASPLRTSKRMGVRFRLRTWRSLFSR